jgi:hypothetical protein
LPRPCFFALLLFLIQLLSAGKLPGQTFPYFPGARAASLGHAAVTLSDAWAIQNNIGALAFINEPQLAFGFHSRLQLPELNTFGALAAWPLRNAAVGAGISRYGTGAYSVQSAGIGYSHQISYLSLGIKLSYLQRSIEQLGSHGSLVLEAGGKAELLPKLHFAAHAYNLSQSRFSRTNEELIPTLLKAGISYLPTEELRLHFQTFKDIEYPARFSAAIEYAIIPQLQLRCGIQTRPVQAGFGLGFRLRRVLFDYAFQHQNPLGTRHHLNIGYNIQKKNQP